MSCDTFYPVDNQIQHKLIIRMDLYFSMIVWKEIDIFKLVMTVWKEFDIFQLVCENWYFHRHIWVEIDII